MTGEARTIKARLLDMVILQSTVSGLEKHMAYSS